MFDKENYMSIITPSKIYDELIKDNFYNLSKINSDDGYDIKRFENIYYINNIDEETSYIKISNIQDVPIYKLAIFINGDFETIDDISFGNSAESDIEINYYYQTILNDDIVLYPDNLEVYLEKTSNIFKKVLILLDDNYNNYEAHDGTLEFNFPAGIISSITMMSI